MTVATDWDRLFDHNAGLSFHTEVDSLWPTRIEPFILLMPSQHQDNQWQRCQSGDIANWVEASKKNDQNRAARRLLLKSFGVASLVLGVGGASYFLREKNAPTTPVQMISCPMCIQNLPGYHRNQLSRQMREQVAMHLNLCSTCDRIYQTHYRKRSV